MTKSLLIKSSAMVILILTTLTISIAGWLTTIDNKADTATLGDVSVSVDVYFLYQGEKIRDNIEFVAENYNGQSFTKQGVYRVNLSSVSNVQFIEYLRVDVIVSSKVDTYLRIAPYEQLTIKYPSGNNTIEVAIVQEQRMNFNYNNTQDPLDLTKPYFYDNSEQDGFYYLTDKVKRDELTGEKTYSFIGAFPPGTFSIYEERFSLQLGFIVEAVQAIQGPEINWGLPNRPWDEGEWT